MQTSRKHVGCSRGCWTRSSQKGARPGLAHARGQLQPPFRGRTVPGEQAPQAGTAPLPPRAASCPPGQQAQRAFQIPTVTPSPPDSPPGLSSWEPTCATLVTCAKLLSVPGRVGWIITSPRGEAVTQFCRRQHRPRQVPASRGAESGLRCPAPPSLRPPRESAVMSSGPCTPRSSHSHEVPSPGTLSAAPRCRSCSHPLSCKQLRRPTKESG